MATSNSLEGLARRMSIVANGVYENVGRSLRKAALAADQVAVIASPVDTGRARSNWIVTFGAEAPGESTFPPGEKGKGAANGAAAATHALGQAGQALGTYKTELGAIFITNNTPYILNLNSGKGSLQQPVPDGLIGPAVLAAQAVLDKERIVP